jgi:hypothetical protein
MRQKRSERQILVQYTVYTDGYIEEKKGEGVVDYSSEKVNELLSKMSPSKVNTEGPFLYMSINPCLVWTGYKWIYKADCP